MNEHLKQRLVGAVVLVVLAVIFVPMLLTGGTRTSPSPATRNVDIRLPGKEFSSRIVPLERAEPPVPVKAPASATSLPAVAPPKTGEKPKTASAQSRVAKKPKPSVQKTPVKTATAKKAAPAKPAKDQRVGLTAWAVQLGSFSKSENAAALRDRLQASGYTAFVAPSYGKSGKMTRVYVGPELARDEAEATLKKLRDEKALRGMQLRPLVVRYPGG